MSRLSFREPPHEDSLRARCTEDALNALRSKVPRGVISNASELDSFINNVHTLFKPYTETIQFVTGCYTDAGFASYAAIVAQNPQRPDVLTLLAKGRAFRPGDVAGYTFYNYADDDRGARYDARFRDLRKVVDEMMHAQIVRAETQVYERNGTGRQGQQGGPEAQGVGGEKGDRR